MYSRTIEYHFKGWAFNLTLNPFKLGTTVIDRVTLNSDNTHLLPYRVRMYMIPFLTVERWNYKGKVTG